MGIFDFVDDIIGGGGDDKQTQEVKSSPWEPSKPYLKGIMQGAYDWYGNPQYQYQEFPFSSLAWFTPEQQFGLDLQAMRGYFGSPMSNLGSRLATDTIGGQYVNPNTNPYLGQFYGKAAGDLSNSYLNTTLPTLKSTSQAAGMGGSTADALLQGQLMRNLGDSLQNLGTGIYGGAYDKERTIQNQMLNMIPQFRNIEQQDLANLMSVGDVRQQMAQNVLNEMKQVWDTRQSQPYNRLAQYANLITPMGGLGGKQTQSLQAQGGGGILSNLLGFGSSLMGLGNIFGLGGGGQQNYSTGSYGSSMGSYTPFQSGSEAAGWDLF